jgi:hypothetical protein
MGGLLIGLRRVLVAVRTPDFRKAFRRMDVRFGLLMAVCAPHASRSVYGSFKGLLLYIQGKERPIFVPLAEAGILMTFQAFGVLRRMRGTSQE